MCEIPTVLSTFPIKQAQQQQVLFPLSPFFLTVSFVRLLVHPKPEADFLRVATTQEKGTRSKLLATNTQQEKERLQEQFLGHVLVVH